MEKRRQRKPSVNISGKDGDESKAAADILDLFQPSSSRTHSL